MQRLHLLGNEAGEPLRDPHAHAADSFGPQPDRRGQDQVPTIPFEQVDRTDVGFEPPLNQVDDVAQRLGGVAALGDEPADFLKRPEHRVFMGGDRLTYAHGTSGGTWTSERKQERCPAT